jgi:hypothetical protein
MTPTAHHPLVAALVGADNLEVLPSGATIWDCNCLENIQSHQLGELDLINGRPIFRNGPAAWAQLATRVLIHDLQPLRDLAPNGCFTDGSTTFIDRKVLASRITGKLEELYAWYEQACMSPLAVSVGLPASPEFPLVSSKRVLAAVEGAGLPASFAQALDLRDRSSVADRLGQCLWFAKDGACAQISSQWQAILDCAPAQLPSFSPTASLIDEEWSIVSQIGRASWANGQSGLSLVDVGAAAAALVPQIQELCALSPPKAGALLSAVIIAHGVDKNTPMSDKIAIAQTFVEHPLCTVGLRNLAVERLSSFYAHQHDGKVHHASIDAQLLALPLEPRPQALFSLAIKRITDCQLLANPQLLPLYQNLFATVSPSDKNTLFVARNAPILLLPFINSGGNPLACDAKGSVLSYLANHPHSLSEDGASDDDGRLLAILTVLIDAGAYRVAPDRQSILSGLSRNISIAPCVDALQRLLSLSTPQEADWVLFALAENKDEDVITQDHEIILRDLLEVCIRTGGSFLTQDKSGSTALSIAENNTDSRLGKLFNGVRSQLLATEMDAATPSSQSAAKPMRM